MKNLNDLINQADTMTYGSLLIVVAAMAIVFIPLFIKMFHPKLK